MTAANRLARTPAVKPSPTQPAVKTAAEAITAQLRALSVEQAKAVAGDVEAVHRLRVATRRLRAALRLLREVAPESEAGSEADELAWLCGAIGAVRDLDVLAQVLERRATRLEADFIRALAPLSDAIREQRAIEHERLVAALDSERYRGLVQRLGTVAPAPVADSVALGTVAARLVRPPLRAMLRAGAGLDESSPPETLHRLRVRAKKLRYTLEPMRAVGGKPMRRMLRRLERVQERVGMYHDAVTAAAWLRGWVAESHEASPASMMAVGALIHSLERRVSRLRTRSLKAWRRAEMDETARAVLRQLNGVAAQARLAAKPPLALVPVVRVS
jgi:CHAD domain-containing protein